MWTADENLLAEFTMLTEAERDTVEEIVLKYPHKSVASMEVLRMIQNSRGWISDEDIREVSDLLEMTPEELDSIASFYDLLFRKRVGRHVILVCDSVSCWITGYKGIRHYLQKALGINMGDTTDDGRFTLLPVACLGVCDAAPAMLIDEDLYEQVDDENIDEILSRYE
jgi:NADH-quinone oxidoreductase subunit E